MDEKTPRTMEQMLRWLAKGGRIDETILVVAAEHIEMLKRLIALERLIADGPTLDPDHTGAHWDGCWRVHVWCYVARLYSALQEVPNG